MESANISWRDRMASRLPKVAIVIHDLLMVVVCWQGLHLARFSMLLVDRPWPIWDWRMAVV